MAYPIGEYRATRDLLSICSEAVTIRTYMDCQGKATVVCHCNLYMMMRVIKAKNHQSADLDCISLNEAESRSWSLSVNHQRASFKA